MIREIIEKLSSDLLYTRGVYIALKMKQTSIDKLEEFTNKYLNGIEFNYDQHCTLIYSKKPFFGEIESKEYSIEAIPTNYSKFGKDGEALVVEIHSQELFHRNSELVEKYGFVSDFSEYKPHFTLSYNAGDIDISNLPMVDFTICFENETVEHIKADFGN